MDDEHDEVSSGDSSLEALKIAEEEESTDGTNTTTTESAINNFALPADFLTGKKKSRQCNLCEFKSKSTYSAKKHAVVHLPNHVSLFKCPYPHCKMTSNHKSNVGIHMKSAAHNEESHRFSTHTDIIDNTDLFKLEVQEALKASFGVDALDDDGADYNEETQNSKLKSSRKSSTEQSSSARKKWTTTSTFDLENPNVKDAACRVCKRVVQRKLWSTHATRHLTTDHFRCSLCQFVANHTQKVVQHIAAVHGNNKRAKVEDLRFVPGHEQKYHDMRKQCFSPTKYVYGRSTATDDNKSSAMTVLRSPSLDPQVPADVTNRVPNGGRASLPVNNNDGDIAVVDRTQMSPEPDENRSKDSIARLYSNRRHLSEGQVPLESTPNPHYTPMDDNDRESELLQEIIEKQNTLLMGNVNSATKISLQQEIIHKQSTLLRMRNK